MPTYEYACSACGHKFEEFQSITAKPTTKCPSCGKRKVKRLISAGAGFIFKGSGFYITDYRDAKYQADAKGDKAPTAEPAKSDGPKSESKSDTPAKSESTKSDSPKSESAPAKSESKPAPKSESKSDSKPSGKSKK